MKLHAMKTVNSVGLGSSHKIKDMQLQVPMRIRKKIPLRKLKKLVHSSLVMGTVSLLT
ncbi:hypothetical protein CDL12_22981 [Handroanthus impetiginosus]|uniref:Uncharacterized protein n=1 Tax=Handroanthus impetiginosus TaxID=429701 RepID=A0A2G9GGR7_9LAMI|nr:hypothetical protein CDL12_22981 [Handroanthus impetiginosus]